MLEAWLDIDSTMEYYNCGDFPFNFGFVNMDEAPSAAQIKDEINVWLENLPPGKTPNWVLGNHDRKRLGTRLGTEFIDLFNMISLTLPGFSLSFFCISKFLCVNNLLGKILDIFSVPGVKLSCCKKH